MLLGDLQSKDVINVVDGNKLGRISNLEIDPTSGRIISDYRPAQYQVCQFLFFREQRRHSLESDSENQWRSDHRQLFQLLIERSRKLVPKGINNFLLICYNFNRRMEDIMGCIFGIDIGERK